MLQLSPTWLSACSANLPTTLLEIREEQDQDPEVLSLGSQAGKERRTSTGL